jgi:hypothetical protein
MNDLAAVDHNYPVTKITMPVMLKPDDVRGVDPPPNHRQLLLFCRELPTSRIHLSCQDARLRLRFLAIGRPLDLRDIILADESVPKLVVGIPLRHVAVTFRRFMATYSLERTFAQAIEVNVRAALL